MVGQSTNESPIDAAKSHHSFFRLPWKKAAKATEPQPEEKAEEAAPSEQVAEPSEAVAEPSEMIIEPAEEATNPNDQDY
jgi:hypothetical protein